MQIHELNRKQLNEVDLAGPNGVFSNIGAAGKALMQPGGAKDALRTVTPGAGQGAFGSARNLLPGSTATGGTHDLAMSDFAQRMQAVKNNAAMKQVAANLQKQWNQISKTLPAAQQAATPPTTATAVQSPEQIRKAKQAAAAKVAQGQMAGKPAASATTPNQTTTSAPGYSSVKMNAPAGIPTVGGSKLPQPTLATPPKATPPTAMPAKSTEPIVVGKGQKPLDPKNPADAALIAKIQAAQKKAAPVVTQESLQLTETASLDQLTAWYKKSVIPKSMAAASAKYLKNPNIQTALKNIVATGNQPDQQSEAFLNLVSATSVVSQQISAKNPQAAASSGGSPTANKTLTSSADVAKTNILKTAGITSSQIDAIAKLTSGLTSVNNNDPNTIAYLQALGFKTI